MTATIKQSTSISSTLFVALELSKTTWKLAFACADYPTVRIRNIAGGDLQQFESELLTAKQKFALPDDADVVTCYEAGRDGFWIHRALEATEVSNDVIESASLEVDRRMKQRKTDRLDVQKMVHALVRFHRGERGALRPIHVPSVEDEDVRYLQRGLQAIRRDKRRITTRIKSLLFAQGIRLEKIDHQFEALLKTLKTGDENPIGEYLQQRLRLDFDRLKLCVSQIRELEECRAELFRQANTEAGKCATRQEIGDRLIELCGIGPECAWTLSTELFAWREFKNRRQLGAVVGLTPTPYSSGKLNREQGISKAGRGEVRSLLTEIAWLWIRYQPQSELTRWYINKTANQGTRIRRIAIIALARKLVIALWKYAMQGEIPRGAKFKSAEQKRRHRLTASLGAVELKEVSMA